MPFAPLQTSTREGDLVDDSDMQRQQPCSPRAMYSLAVVVRPFNEFILPSPDRLEARDQKYQGRSIEGYPIETHHVEHSARTVHSICRKVGD